MASSARAVFAGLATYDLIQVVERLPLPDEKVAALSFLTAAGGPAANAAVAYALLAAGDGPASRPTLVTALPQHPLSSMIADDLLACGVDVTIAATYEGAPITASIMVTKATGERAVVSPTSAATDMELVADPLPKMNNTLLVLVDGYFRSISLPLAQAAREAGIPVILDAGSFKPYTDELLLNVDVAVVSEAFRPPHTDSTPDAVFAYLRARGVMWSAITRGSGSVMYMCPGGSGEVAVPPVADVVDTLGAGDFFHGALAYRIATQGLDGDRFPEDLAFAAEVTARSLTTVGTREWLNL